MTKLFLFASFLLFNSTTEASAPKPPPSHIVAEGVSRGFKPGTDKEEGFSDKIHLKGSRAETVNFVLKISGLQKCQTFQIKNPPTDLEFRFFKVETLPTRQRSFPGARVGLHADPLLPLHKLEACPAKNPTFSTATWIWGEMRIRPDAPPGDRSVILNFEDGPSIQMQIRVWKMTFPSEPSLRSYTEYAPYGGSIGHYGKWHVDEARLNGKAIDLLLAHGILPLNSWLRSDLFASPRPGESYRDLVLARLPKSAPVQLPGRIDLLQEPEKEIRTHFQSLNKIIMNEKLKGRAFVYLADEPKPSEIAKLLKVAKIVRKVSPDLRILVTTPAQPALDGWVDDYAIPINFARDKAKVPPKAKLWWYVSCMSHGCDSEEDPGFPDFTVERPSSFIRSIGWLAEKEGIHDFLYFQVNYAYQFYPAKDPWNDLWAFTGNGDGTLVYPGRAGERGFKDHEPVASIRLKLWRETISDHQYLTWLRESRDSSKNKQNLILSLEKMSTSPDRFERDGRVYQERRDQIGDYLNGIQETRRP